MRTPSQVVWVLCDLLRGKFDYFVPSVPLGATNRFPLCLFWGLFCKPLAVPSFRFVSILRPFFFALSLLSFLRFVFVLFDGFPPQAASVLRAGREGIKVFFFLFFTRC